MIATGRLLATAASLVGYPGALADWELLWLQNVLLVFAQLTTGATLYTGADGYAAYLSAPIGALTGRAGRGLLVAVHAVTGLGLVAVNVAFAWSWFAGQGRPVPSTVGARPVLAGTTLVLVAAFVLMAAFGLALYGTLRPNGTVPLPSVRYATARKAHRGLFAVVVAVLGYHVLLTPRVYLVWTAWLRRADPWGGLVLAALVVWGVLVGLTARMLGEWATGDVFGRWERDRSDLAAAIGGGGGFAIGAGTAVGASAPLATLGATVGVAVVLAAGRGTATA